jgi:hypothetical protein
MELLMFKRIAILTTCSVVLSAPAFCNEDPAQASQEQTMDAFAQLQASEEKRAAQQEIRRQEIERATSKEYEAKMRALAVADAQANIENTSLLNLRLKQNAVIVSGITKKLVEKRIIDN